jgi:hypothetical protein
MGGGQEYFMKLDFCRVNAALRQDEIPMAGPEGQVEALK